MKKKLLAILAAIAVMCGTFPAVALANTAEDEVPVEETALEVPAQEQTSEALALEEPAAEEPAPLAENSCGENATWSFDQSTGTLTISGTGDMDDWTFDNKAPWNQYSSAIRKVVVEKGITHIGAYAFSGAISLKVIEMPDGLVSIGDRAFSNCSSLGELVIPESVQEIGKWAFSMCSSLKSVG